MVFPQPFDSIARMSGDEISSGSEKRVGGVPLHELPNTETRKQTIESLQEDIKTGNSYRMESLKLMLTLATGLLAFTVSFRPTLANVTDEWLIYWSWCSLGISIVSGIAVMLCWERFYLSYRLNWHNQAQRGKTTRKVLTFCRRVLLVLQFGFFAYGVIGVAVFAAKNFNNVVHSAH
jgi:hypothetical protein